MGDVTAARSTAHSRDARPTGPRGPAVAGIDLSAGAVHVVVGRREDSRLRVVGRGDAPLPEAAVSGGLVADREQAADALRSAFAAAEHGQRAERSSVALDGEDIRTFHGATTF